MLEQICDDMVSAAGRSDGSAVQQGISALWEAARGADADALTRVVRRLRVLFPDLGLGVAGRLAILTGGLVEIGAEPDGLAGDITTGLGLSLDVAAEFVTAWRSVFGDDRALPEPINDRRVFEGAIEALATGPRRSRWRRRPDRADRTLPDGEAYRLVEGWFCAADWALPATTLLQIERVRASFPMRAQLARAAARVAPDRDDLGCLIGLLEMLDDERLVVLHRPTGRGFEVTIGGIGDNFQLHTLLAATLSGEAADGLLEGVRPDPAWVAAATDGPVEPPGEPVRGQFNLVDAYGAWIWNEGRPADIPALDGRRVVVLDPPPYQRTWNLGRFYPNVRPTVRLDRMMDAEEAAGWLSRAAAPTRAGGRPAEVHMRFSRPAGD